MTNTTSQAGFSAVELLITLFIAVAFIGAGYQLYAIIIKDGSEASLRAKANTIAYENLRTYSAKTTTPCTDVAVSPQPTVPANTIAGATIFVTINCPYGVGDPVSKVSVSVRYGSPQIEVVHAAFVNN